MANDKAIYDKMCKNMEETEKIDVAIPLDIFENEARDFSNHNVSEFYKSSVFNKEFAIEGRSIRTQAKIWLIMYYLLILY